MIKLKKIIAFSLALLLVISFCVVPASADGLLVFNPVSDAGAYVIFDMVMGLRNSSAESQAILDYINRVRQEACNEGLYHPWANNYQGGYLTSANYTPIAWDGVTERYALTRAVDICFSFGHVWNSSYDSVVGIVDGGVLRNRNFENISSGTAAASIDALLNNYYREKQDYINLCNEAVAKGLSGAELKNYIASNGPARGLGHFMDMTSPTHRSVGGATVVRGGWSRNVLIYSDGASSSTSFLNNSGTTTFRVPISASKYGSVFTYTPPSEVEYGRSAKGSFTLTGGSAQEQYISASGITITALNPDIMTIDSDLQTFRAIKSGTASFRINAGSTQLGTFTVNAVAPLSDISLASQPSSLNYTQSGGYSLAGASIAVKYADGRTETMAIRCFWPPESWMG